MLKPHETCLRSKYQLKQRTITWEKLLQPITSSVGENDLKFQNPKIFLQNSIQGQAKVIE